MKTWYCKDCLAHNCRDKTNNPYKVVMIDADKYCHQFWNHQSEPFYSEKGRIEWKE